MRKLLIVSHGSPVKQNEEDFYNLFSVIRGMLGEEVSLAFLEYGKPLFDEKVEEIKMNTNTDFFIQPILMFRAGHMKDDIIGKLNGIKNAVVMPTLSENPYFVDFFASYIKQRSMEIQEILEKNKSFKEDCDLREKSQNILFVFVGRGTSDPEATSMFYAFSRIVWEKIGKIGDIEMCFAEVSHPLLSQVLGRTKIEFFDRVLIVPVIFFRGFVLEKIRKEIQESRYGEEELKKIVVLEPPGYYNPEGLAESIISFYRSFENQNHKLSLF